MDENRRIKACGKQFGTLRISAAVALIMLVPASPALALSEIQREDLPPPVQERSGDVERIPQTGPLILQDEPPDPPDAPPSGAPAAQPGDVAPEPAEGLADDPDSGPPEAIPEVVYDLDRLPEPVRRMRQLILDACIAGNLEALRALVGSGEEKTQLSFSAAVDDPVAFLREMSGDDQGHEILAILAEVLEAGYVHLDPGEPEELYVWPYFFAIPLDTLDARQRVELFRLVTAGDYEDMKNYGTYIFYRVGITPEGRWAFFVAGD